MNRHIFKMAPIHKMSMKCILDNTVRLTFYFRNHVFQANGNALIIVHRNVKQFILLPLTL